MDKKKSFKIASSLILATSNLANAQARIDNIPRTVDDVNKQIEREAKERKSLLDFPLTLDKLDIFTLRREMPRLEGTDDDCSTCDPLGGGTGGIF